ncbi:MAG: hypothetical protein ACE366_11405 [Bradymonadia bacterium]
MIRRLSVFALALSMACIATSAHARTVGGNHRGWTKIQKGVFELGFENLLLYRQNTVEVSDTTTNTTTDLSYTVGLTPRYFIMDNLALGLNVNFFLRSRTDETDINGTVAEATSDDSGIIGFLMANYYVRLGSSFFFKPGIGIGGFTGTRETPVTGSSSLKQESTLAGVAARGDIGFAFYANEHFNLKAGIDIIYRSGELTPESDDMTMTDEEGQPFSTLEAAFNVGAAYSF